MDEKLIHINNQIYDISGKLRRCDWFENPDMFMFYLKKLVKLYYELKEESDDD